MKPLLIATGLILSGSSGIYLLRRDTLRELEHRAAALRQSQEAPPVPSAGLKKRFDPKPILTALRPDVLDRETAQSLSAEMKRLSDAEFEQLFLAAKAESATAPRLLMGIAAFAFVAPESDRLVPDSLVPALTGSPLKEQGATYIFRHVLMLWVQQNPGPASLWLKEALAAGTLDGSPDKKDFTMLAAHGAVRAAPVQELENIRAQPEGKQDNLLRAGAESLHNAEEARAFSAALMTWHTAAAKGRPLEAAMDKLREFSGFPAASAWLDALPAATAPQKDDARIALTLSDTNAADISARAGWVVTRAEAAAQPEVAARLATQWIAKDHNAAGTWLNANRSAPWYDAAAVAFATGIAGKEPASAFDWALTVTDESARRSALKDVMTKWQSDNAAAALEYLEKSALPADWKTEFTGNK